MVLRKAMAIFVLAGCFGITAVPVHGFFQAHGIFNPSNKYQDWFRETTWRGDPFSGSRGARVILASSSVAEKYPYPGNKLVMTEKMWLKSTKAVEFGNSSWFDSEVVRHRADIEKHPEAMNFLAWMYEKGQGLDRDYRKAYMWYERAKMAGKVDLRGSSSKIFQRMEPQDQYFAKLQQAEDLQALKKSGKLPSKGFEKIGLHVLKSQRDPSFYKLQRAQTKKKGLAPY